MTIGIQTLWVVTLAWIAMNLVFFLAGVDDFQWTIKSSIQAVGFSLTLQVAERVGLGRGNGGAR